MAVKMINGQTSTSTGHSIIVTTMAEVIGISILAIIADSSDTGGKFAVALMIGWFLIFLMSGGAGFVTELTSKL